MLTSTGSSRCAEVLNAITWPPRHREAHLKTLLLLLEPPIILVNDRGEKNPGSMSILLHYEPLNPIHIFYCSSPSLPFMHQPLDGTSLAPAATFLC